MDNIVSISFYERDTQLVAQELLGKILVRQLPNNLILTGIITETEAYREHDDPASHAFNGITNRNKAMFGPVGHAYIYFIYGTHYCLNVVAKNQQQQAGAVLIRAVEPLDGIAYMMQTRNKYDKKGLVNGPGKLAQAFNIDQELNGLCMTKAGLLYIIDNENDKDLEIQATSRIGISRAMDRLWRFIVKEKSL